MIVQNHDYGIGKEIGDIASWWGSRIELRIVSGAVI